MKKFIIKTKHETGQVIPLVVLMFFAIIAMVALIIDGGSIMSNRRTAQAAADAGALAGAKKYCSMSNKNSAATKNAVTDVVKNYLLLNNAVLTKIDFINNQVDVTATVEQNTTFFAGIFGFFGQNVENLNASAVAAAGCYGPKGESVLPIAWNCRAPSAGGGPFDPNMGCKIQTIDWKELGPLVDTESIDSLTIDGIDYSRNYRTNRGKTDDKSITDSEGKPPKEIYIVMETDKTCIEDDPTNGALVCDLDKDGKKEILVSGDRGFLYLTRDTNAISKWITNPPTFVLKTHVWLTGSSGGQVDVYIKMIDNGFPGTIRLVPVYNYFCANDPRTDTTCMNEAHDTVFWPALPPAGDDFTEIKAQNDNYHILTFDPFYITCVSTEGDCPGINFEKTLITDPKVLQDLNKMPVIEGLFLRGATTSSDFTQICPIELGNCTISLSK